MTDIPERTSSKQCISNSSDIKILIAMDSFKGSISSIEAGNAVREGIIKVNPETDITVCPLADGGEGTMQALCYGRNGELIELTVTGPLGDPIQSQYAILKSGVAVIEIASAAGLPLIPEEKRNPLYTTTYGVGELIRDAVNRGCREFVIGLGGSGTNDGGVGMLCALGWEFRDSLGNPILPGAVGLQNLTFIGSERVMPELAQCKFRIACDVRNPLLGENGCSAIFAPQKGADAKSITKMEQWLTGYSLLVQRHFPAADPSAPGTGAAGGLGFAFSVFLGGKMERGAKLIGDYLCIDDKISNSDLIITGEGCFDGQSTMGKGPMHIAGLGKKYGKPVIVLAGSIGPGADSSIEKGVSAYFSIIPAPMTQREAMDCGNTYTNLKNTAMQLIRLLTYKGFILSQAIPSNTVTKDTK